MKKIRSYTPLLVLVAVVLAGLFLLVRLEDNRTSIVLTDLVPEAISQPEGLTMTVDYVKWNAFTITFHNNTDTEYTFGWGCEVQREQDGVWYTLERKTDVAHTAQGYITPTRDSLTWEETVSEFGNLDPGSYRLIKTVIAPGEPGDRERFQSLAALFTIDE